MPHAHADEATNMKAALDTRLAYVITGLPDVDAMSKAGLTGLGLVLKARTSYEPQEPMGVDLGAGRSVLLSPALLADGSAREESVARGAVEDRRLYAHWAAPSCSTPAI